MTVLRFNGEGYGVTIFRHLEEVNVDRITLGVIYDILERLSKNGYIDTIMGEPTPVRGGMKKKFYRITESGIEKLIESREISEKCMSGIAELIKKHQYIRKA